MFTHNIYLVVVGEYQDLSADRRRRADHKTSHQSPALDVLPTGYEKNERKCFKLNGI